MIFNIKSNFTFPEFQTHDAFSFAYTVYGFVNASFTCFDAIR